LPVQAPVGIESDFAGVVDLVRYRLVRFTGDDGETVVTEPVPATIHEEMTRRREAMIERLADVSEEIMTAYLDGETVPVELMQRVIRQLCLDRQAVPVLAGSAKRRIGIQTLMDAVVDYLPSPADCPPVPAHRVKNDEPVHLQPDAAAPFAGLVFKVLANPSADLLYVRIYTGTLRANATLMNSRTRDSVRAKQILRLYAKNTEVLDTAGPGDIVGLIGPKDCGTGDSLCDMRTLVAFEKIAFPEPVISVAVEPRYSRDKDRVDDALALLCREDPTLHRGQDEETGQRIISGMGELHLEVSLNRLRDQFNVETRIGSPRVAYRETLRGKVQEKAVFHRFLGETELFAEVAVAFTPMPRGEATFVVTNSVRQGSGIPKEFIKAAEKALDDGLRTGGNHGYPLIYLAADLCEIKVLPEKTTEGAVVGAVLQAIDQAIRTVGTVVLEPLMHLEILSPVENVGEISMYLQPRRSVIHDMTAVGEIKRISCEVPLAEMFGFGKALPKLSGGRASFSMEPCGYQELPPDIAKRLFGLA
jgi:elongation factor G